MLNRAWKTWATALVLGFAASLPAHAAETPATLSGVKLVGADEVKKLLEAGVPVIDTRVAAEYAEKTIKGAKSVPYKE